MSPVHAMSLWARNAIGDIESAPSTFSSWHNCMQKAYCKWPAIIGIVIGSLVVISIIGCLVSCICCGVQCCRGCFGCCYDCCECCVGSGRRGRTKYADPPPPAPYYQQAPPPSNMHYGYQQSPAPPAYRGPQTAQFDHSSAKINEDALPAMPTWADATTKRVEDTTPVEEVEMNRLDAPDQHAGMVPTTGRVSRGGYTELPSSAVGSPPAVHQEHRGPEPSRFPQPPSPQTVGYARSSPAPSPAPYRGFENPAPAPAPARVPNFHTPRPYDRPSPSSPPAQQPAYSSYDQQQQPYRTTSPRIASPPSPQAQQPPYPSYEHQPQQQSQQLYRAVSPRVPSPPSPPAQQPAYVPHGYQPQQQPQQSYQAYSPSIPSTSPPPFSAVADDMNDRPPSLLQAGRKPVANSWRNV
ncbi:hypothetical protein VTN77DRAFT_3642 [Rasamsonia byssochlamydoides]|uniref:uncharacterized protein n=1 Tax=Rasamsonia byssochlamydoides TaxID=89139 RepID=UPI003741F707